MRKESRGETRLGEREREGRRRGERKRRGREKKRREERRKEEEYFYSPKETALIYSHMLTELSAAGPGWGRMKGDLFQSHSPSCTGNGGPGAFLLGPPEPEG